MNMNQCSYWGGGSWKLFCPYPFQHRHEIVLIFGQNESIVYNYTQAAWDLKGAGRRIFQKFVLPKTLQNSAGECQEQSG